MTGWSGLHLIMQYCHPCLLQPPFFDCFGRMIVLHHSYPPNMAIMHTHTMDVCCPVQRSIRTLTHCLRTTSTHLCLEDGGLAHERQAQVRALVAHGVHLAINAGHQDPVAAHLRWQGIPASSDTNLLHDDADRLTSGSSMLEHHVRLYGLMVLRLP